MMRLTENLPLVSVIIPTYNYAEFLPRAIASVLKQTYGNVEVIVIDDGSEDNTMDVVTKSSVVKYFYQQNKGLSAARNAGIERSKGEYLVFLDADDWLETDALEQHFLVIQDKPGIAFVSGNYYLLRAGSYKEPVMVTVANNHYTRLLQGNYIGMHAAVMFQRWVFRKIRYDETLKACEDYDLYLTITRQYPVIHHQKFMATYYFHTAGLSHNYQAMMDSIATVMKRQAPYITTGEEKSAYAHGLQQWKDYYQLLQESLLMNGREPA